MLRAVASQILSGTWANKPSSAAKGALYFASDVGEHGTLFQYGTSRWRVANGIAALKTGEATAVTNSESLVIQSLIPAGAWQVGDTMRIRLSLTKSGATDTGLVTVRIGTAGTTGDTAVTGLSAFSALAAANRTGGFEFGVKLVSATSAQRLGNTAATASAYTGGTSGTASAATTITDASANALYVSVGIASGGTTNTVDVQEAVLLLASA